VIALQWSAATDDTGVTGYRITRNGTQVATTTTLAWTNMVLKPATTYTYTVAAVDAAGNAGPAVEVSATTKADKIRPSKPPGSRIRAVGSRQTKLTWGAATDNVAVRGYRLYVDGAYYKTIFGRTAYIRTSRGTHSFSVRTVDTSGNRSYRIYATIRVR
jgi:chitodextrinase